jgi:release factor glutamine methyltransferase
LLRKFISFFWRPFVRLYTSGTRSYSYESIRVRIPSGVFHPAFYLSTKHLIQFISKKEIAGKQVLEIGSGSGIVSIYAAKQKKAIVTAVDISSSAVITTSENARRNKTEFTILRSDLFENVPQKEYDYLLVNPPYYAKPAANESEYAWNAGENLNYFIRFFEALKGFTNINSITWMVLSDECDLIKIESICKNAGYGFDPIHKKTGLFGTTIIYQIQHK